MAVDSISTPGNQLPVFPWFGKDNVALSFAIQQKMSRLQNNIKEYLNFCTEFLKVETFKKIGIL